MFERLELRFSEVHYPNSDLPWNDEKGKLTIAYDKTQNKTYCYYYETSLVSSNNLDFVLDGNELIEEIEKTDLRNWKYLFKPGDFAYSFEWFIEFNDKNQPSRYINYDWNVPKDFYDFIKILDKYFPKTNILNVSNTFLPYNGDFKKEIYDFTHFTMNWKPDDETLVILKKLISYIDIFENKKEFGKWKPAPNTAEYYSSENLFYYSKDVINFCKVIKELEDEFIKLQFKFGHYESLLPDIEEFAAVSDEYLTDTRMAGTFLIKYRNEYCYGNACSYDKFNEALKNGTIIKILKFIKEINHL